MTGIEPIMSITANNTVVTFKISTKSKTIFIGAKLRLFTGLIFIFLIIILAHD
jgi:hypothetical protein